MKLYKLSICSDVLSHCVSWCLVLTQDFGRSSLLPFSDVQFILQITYEILKRIIIILRIVQFINLIFCICFTKLRPSFLQPWIMRKTVGTHCHTDICPKQIYLLFCNSVKNEKLAGRLRNAAKEPLELGVYLLRSTDCADIWGDNG